MTKYFMKELSDSPVYINGHPLRFDIMETSDPSLIHELENCVRRHVGGVIEIDKEQFAEEVKKKESGIVSNGNSKPRHSRQELSAIRLAEQARVAERVASPSGRGGMFAARQKPDAIIAPVNHQLPDPIEVPNPSEFTPKPPPTAKLSDILK